MLQQSFIAVKALIRKENKFLILKQVESNQSNNLSGWETPGGRLEDREDILHGLLREIQEETSLHDIKIHFPFHAYSVAADADTNIVGINYLADWISGEVLLDTKEHSRYQWVSLEQGRTLKDSKGLQKELDAYENFLSFHRVSE